MDEGKIIKAYIALRDEREKLRSEWKKKDEELREKMDVLEQELMKRMTEAQLDNIKVRGLGTAFTVEKDSVQVADPIQFMNFIRESGQWELLKAAAVKTAVKAYLEEHGVLPPGLKYTRWKEVQIRRV